VSRKALPPVAPAGTIPDGTGLDPPHPARFGGGRVHPRPTEAPNEPQLTHLRTRPTLARDQSLPDGLLGHYKDQIGRTRCIVAIPDAGGGTLVIDREIGTTDARLVGRIDPDEPCGNVQLLARLYLADVDRRGRCRPVTDDDLLAVGEEIAESAVPWDRPLEDGLGEILRLRVVPVEGTIPAVRSVRVSGEGRAVVSLRDVVGHLENYEPALTMTAGAIRHREHMHVSTVAVRLELRRMHSSSIVLNRRLREHVQRVVATGELSMSEIAMRLRACQARPRNPDR